MTRIDELQKKYPSIAKEVILKWEVLRNGVRDTEDLDKASIPNVIWHHRPELDTARA